MNSPLLGAPRYVIIQLSYIFRRYIDRPRLGGAWKVPGHVDGVSLVLRLTPTPMCKGSPHWLIDDDVGHG